MSDSRNLSSYFNRSSTLVHDACSQFDEHYARPAYANMKQYFEERPIVSTFVTIFTLLSLFPIAFFAGAALLVFLLFTLTSLLSALLATVAVILTLFTFLVIVLCGVFLASIFLTGATISSYSLLRFALHIQREGPSVGVAEWRQETRDTFLSRKFPINKERPFEKEPVDPVIITTQNSSFETHQARGTEQEKFKAHEHDINDGTN